MSSKISPRVFLSNKKISSNFDEELHEIGNVENGTALKNFWKKLIFESLSPKILIEHFVHTSASTKISSVIQNSPPQKSLGLKLKLIFKKKCGGKI